MKNNNIIDLNDNYENLVRNNVITPLDRYKLSFYFDDNKLFFKECKDSIFNEIVGSRVCSYFGIHNTNPYSVMVKMENECISGVISSNYIENGYKNIKFEKLLKDTGFEIMSLENIYLALNKYFNNYNNDVIDRVFDDIIWHYCFDLLMGNIDNGRYNYELLISDDDIKLAPYFDFGILFKFTGTNLLVDNNVSNDIYDNIERLINLNDKYRDRFCNMVNKLSYDKLEQIIDDTNILCDQNTKNIIFLSYNRHLERIKSLINQRNTRRKNG